MDLSYSEKVPQLRGHWKLDIYRGDGRTPENLLRTIEGDNLITTEGKGMIMDTLFGLSSVTKATRIGVGTNNAAAALGNTWATLTGPAEFVNFDASPAPVRAGLVVTVVGTFGTSVANFAWAELGVGSATLLLARIAPLGPFQKSSAVSIVVTYQITQS